MKSHHLFILLLLPFSCQQRQPINTTNPPEVADSIYQKHYEYLLTDYSNHYQIQHDTIINFHTAKHLKWIQHDAVLIEKPSTKKKYPNQIYHESLLQDSLAYVKAYPIRRVNMGGSPFLDRMSKGVYVPISEYQELVTLLKDTRSYNTGVAACFYPKISLIMYDRDGIPLGYISMCLDCNQFRATIATGQPNTAMQGFSKEARKKLRSLFAKWRFDYYGYMSGVDDEKEYRQYLKE